MNIKDDVIIDVKVQRKSKWAKKISKVTPLLSLLGFLICGFCFNAWHPGWVCFFAVPLVEFILNIFRQQGKQRVMTLTTIVCIISYIVLGITHSAWHPGWLVFFLIPIVGTLVD